MIIPPRGSRPWTKFDHVLFSGFIFCCLTVGYLTWSIREPVKYIDKLDLNPSDVTCIAKGYKPWNARDGVCYVEDAVK